MSTLRLHRIDLADTAALTEYHRVQQAAAAHGRPRFAPSAAAHVVGVLQAPNDSHERRVTGAFLGDRLVGAVLTLLPLRDNLELAWVFVSVEPGARRRGVGTALARAGLAAAADAGRRTVLTEVELDGGPTEAEARDHPAIVFARGWGFEVLQREVRRELRLPADPHRLAALDRWAAGAADYRVQAVQTADLGDDDVKAVLRLCGLVGVDAPSGDLQLEPEVFTPASHQALTRARLRSGMTLLTVVARDRHGQIVAFSTQQAPADPSGPVAQHDTYVDRSHRGHGLGAALKAAGTRWWQEHQPTRPCILTCNAETNAHMVRINEVAGFVPVETIFPLIRRGPRDRAGEAPDLASAATGVVSSR